MFLEVCVTELKKDPSLGIAYTGLWFKKPDGSEGLSPWPGQYDYDAQLEGRNQIPTCNVARRDVWERLGGQRQRYAPMGAGEEDAEMWLRAGAVGFSARKVTNAGLFIYSWLSGVVSGSSEHVMTDWRAWHPWTKDKEHPFASVAKPKRFSHPVRQYDEPVVSVIVPVGKEHKREVINVLDSLEAQTFRQWEVIVVDDTGDAFDLRWQQWLRKAYPYVRMVNSRLRGAGAARNTGAEFARAPFLLFVDADDWLHPEAIEIFVNTWQAEQSIMYSDYIGKVYIGEQDAKDAYGDRLLHYSPRIGEASIYYKSAEYDCEKAVRQPYPEKDGLPYVWCLVTALVPKAWHNNIGGFDELMESWEDWDYWIRMARAGYCFARVDKGLVAYRFYSGERREAGLQAAQDLLQYLNDKYAGAETMGCKCKERNPRPAPNQAQRSIPTKTSDKMVIEMTDANMVLCLYNNLNRGDHRVTGKGTNFDYGYRQGGTQFLVHKDDIAAQPHLFVPIQPAAETVPAAPTPEPPPPVPVAAPPVEETPEPEPIIEEPAVAEEEEREETTVEPIRIDDLQTIPGMTASYVQTLNAAGVHTYEDLVAFGPENLQKFKGIGKVKAAQITEMARRKAAGEM
jgi:glycosyltransferase involved in cell wall biosynthesis/predicted flap endonuclease-1-like 5' DNA nuclease